MSDSIQLSSSDAFTFSDTLTLGKSSILFNQEPEAESRYRYVLLSMPISLIHPMSRTLPIEFSFNSLESMRIDSSASHIEIRHIPFEPNNSSILDSIKDFNLNSPVPPFFIHNNFKNIIHSSDISCKPYFPLEPISPKFRYISTLKSTPLIQNLNQENTESLEPTELDETIGSFIFKPKNPVDSTTLLLKFIFPSHKSNLKSHPQSLPPLLPQKCIFHLNSFKFSRVSIKSKPPETAESLHAQMLFTSFISSMISKPSPSNSYSLKKPNIPSLPDTDALKSISSLSTSNSIHSDSDTLNIPQEPQFDPNSAAPIVQKSQKYDPSTSLESETEPLAPPASKHIHPSSTLQKTSLVSLDESTMTRLREIIRQEVREAVRQEIKSAIQESILPLLLSKH